jgi:hypothetical protein
MGKLITAMFLVLPFLASCSKEDASGWYLDSGFTTRLTSYWDDKYPVVTQEDPAKSVDVLQIFQVSKGKEDLYALHQIRSQQLIYETTNPENILSLFRATRVRTEDSCDINEGNFVFFILAFDRDLLRVAFVKYFPCDREDLGWFQTWGSRSVYFSADLATLLHKILPLSLKRESTKR